MALLDPPIVAFITSTRSSVAFSHQIAALADETLVQLYNVTDNTVDFNGGFTGVSINISDLDGLLPNKRYVATFQSNNSSDEFSEEIVPIGFFTEFEDNTAFPRVE